MRKHFTLTSLPLIFVKRFSRVIAEMRSGSQNLDNTNIHGLGAFFALTEFEFDVLAFLQRFETVAANGTVMHKHIFAAVFGCDKTKPLFLVKPFYFTVTQSNSPWAYNKPNA